jgi:hypothetical protein
MLKDYRNERIRRAQEAVRRRELLQNFGDHIKKLAKWVWFATITFRYRVSAARFQLFEFLVQKNRAGSGAPHSLVRAAGLW